MRLLYGRIFYDEDDKDAKSLALIGKLINSLNLVVSEFPGKISLKILLAELRDIEICLFSCQIFKYCFHIMTTLE